MVASRRWQQFRNRAPRHQLVFRCCRGRWSAPVVRGWRPKMTRQLGRTWFSNRLVELGGWHDEALTRLLAEMAKESPDALIGTGFDVDDAERRLWVLEKDQVDMAALDVVPDMRPTKIKAGDVIELRRPPHHLR